MSALLSSWQLNSTRTWSRIAGATAVLIGCTVLLGWVFNIPFLKSVSSGLVPMKANTAIAFVFTGIALWLLNDERATQRRFRVAQICALAVFLLGFLTLSEYIFGWNLGIDQFLFRDATPSSVIYFPGRMAPSSAFCFFMVGIAFWLISRSRRYLLTQIIALMVLLIALLVLAGYLYGVPSLYGVVFTSVALHTAFTFLIVSIGILLVRPKRGLMACNYRKWSWWGDGTTIFTCRLPHSIACGLVTTERSRTRAVRDRVRISAICSVKYHHVCGPGLGGTPIHSTAQTLDGGKHNPHSRIAKAAIIAYSMDY